MAKWYDIDSDLRINGSLTLPSGSLNVSGRNVLNDIDGKLSLTGGILTGALIINAGGATALTIGQGGDLLFVPANGGADTYIYVDTGLQLRTNATSLYLGSSLVWHEGNFDPSTKVSDTGDTMTGQLKILQDVNTPSLMLEGASTGWASGMTFNNTTVSTGRAYGMYAASDGTFHFADYTAGTDRLMVDSSGNFAFTKDIKANGTVPFTITSTVNTPPSTEGYIRGGGATNTATVLQSGADGLYLNQDYSYPINLGGSGNRVSTFKNMLDDGAGKAYFANDISVFRSRIRFAALNDNNHNIYNNYNNIDSEGAWDGLKMNAYAGLDVRIGTYGQQISAFKVANTGTPTAPIANVATRNNTVDDGNGNSTFAGSMVTAGKREFIYSNTVNFPHAVANQKFDIRFGNIGTVLYLEVTLLSTFANANAEGSITRKYAFGSNPNNNIYVNESRYTETLGTTKDFFALSAVTWDATNNTYRIQVASQTSSGNPVNIHIRAIGQDETATTNFKNGLSFSAIYTTDTTVFPAPVVQLPANTTALGTIYLGSQAPTANHAVRADRNIITSATSGLTGGGDLTADRSLAISFAGTGSANNAARSDHTHSNYLSGGVTDQNVGTNFTVKGTLHIGSSAAGNTGDAILYDNVGSKTIHLDAGSEGNANTSTVKVYIGGNGIASFADQVTVKNLVLTDGTKPLVTNLNAELINGIAEKDLTKNTTIKDLSGYGVQTGFEVSIFSGNEIKLSPIAGQTKSVVYTFSGRRVEFNEIQVAIPTNSATSGDKYTVVYIKGPSQGNTEGQIGYVEGTLNGGEPNIDSDAVKLYVIKRRSGNASVATGDITDARRWKSFYFDNSTGISYLYGSLSTTGWIKEGGTLLTSKYAQLNTANTFTGNQSINGRTIVSGAVTYNGTDYSSKVTDGTYTLSLTPREINMSSDLHINSGIGSNVYINELVQVNKAGYLTAPKNAATVTIPAGSTSVKWTHSYGNTSYAISPHPNSFARHVKWDLKNANDITIYIDDPFDQDILVDCILIGY